MIKLIYSLLAFIILTPFAISAPIRTSDSTELLKFATSTSIGAWTVSTNWRTNKPVSSWFGITTEVKDIAGVPTEVVTKIVLRNNQLEGELPVNLNLPDLQVLDLYYNALIGKIPKYFMNKLVTLDLSVNSLTNGGIPDLKSYYPVLENLIIFNNQLAGTIANLSMPSLKTIKLSDNLLTGNIPLFVLPNLEMIEVSKNSLEGEIPVLNLPKLKTLDISHNTISGTFPNMVLPALENLNIESNQISGKFPNLTFNNLINIDIDNNQFTGTLASISLPNLKSFIGFYNDFSGSTPSINCPNLIDLVLSQNKFTTINSNIIAPKVQNVNLSSNLLTDISSLINLTSIVSLVVSDNRLRTVPSFVNLDKMTSLSLKGNLLKTLPVIGPTLNILALQNNKYSFDILETFASKLSQFKSVAYAPQDTILPLVRDVNGTSYTLTVNTGGTGITYQWFQSKKSIVNEKSKSYKTTTNKAGGIYCEVSHPILKQLILTTETKDPTSVSYNDEDFVKLYNFESFPNPTANLINIKLSSEIPSNLNFELYDISGSLVKSYGYNLISNDFNKEIDLTSLPIGSYFLKISDANHYYTSKVIKN